jgi:hypothetical protein
LLFLVCSFSVAGLAMIVGRWSDEFFGVGRCEFEGLDDGPTGFGVGQLVLWLVI